MAADGTAVKADLDLPTPGRQFLSPVCSVSFLLWGMQLSQKLSWDQNKAPNKSLASYSACPTGQQPGPGAGEGKQDGDGGAHVFGAQETRNPCKTEAPKSGTQCVMVWV